MNDEQTFPTPADRLLQIVESDFVEMPGLRLNKEQAKKLWSLTDEQCTRILARLVQRGFLRRTNGGMYVRSR